MKTFIEQIQWVDSLVEEEEIVEADMEALKRALAISKWKKAGGKVDKQPDNIEKWWGQLSPADRKRAATIAQYKKEKKMKKEEVLEDGTDRIVQKYKEVTPGELGEEVDDLFTKMIESTDAYTESIKKYSEQLVDKAKSLIDEAKGTAYPATVETLRKIVKDKQYQTVMFKSGQAKVDLFTASAMIQVYDALKPKTKTKFETMIKDKAGFMKSQAFAMKMMGK
jgi:flagellar biosynthesis chaperone FliJ